VLPLASCWWFRSHAASHEKPQAIFDSDGGVMWIYKMFGADGRRVSLSTTNTIATTKRQTEGLNDVLSSLIRTPNRTKSQDTDPQLRLHFCSAWLVVVRIM